MSEFSAFPFWRSCALAVLICVLPLSAQAQGDVIEAGEIVIENVTPEIVPDSSELESEAQAESNVSQDPPRRSGGIIGDDGTVSIVGPSAMTGGMPSNDDFFDAESLVPSGEMAKEGPVKVNPRTQPASKLVTVKKDVEADSKTAQIVAAERAMALGMYDSALEMFDRLFEKNPRDPRVLMGRAVSLQKLGRFDDAMQTYDILAKMDPKNVEVKVNMLGLLATRYPSVALRQLMDLHRDNPSHVGLTAQLAVAFAQAGDTPSAIKYFGVASSMEPHNAGHIYNMAIMADRSGNISDAIKYYEMALEIDAVQGAGRSIPRDSVYERLAQIR